jgi:hypothetical protein
MLLNWREHIKRVKYQIEIWKRSHIAEPYVPAPIDGHERHAVDNVIEQKLISGDFLPQQLVDVLVNDSVLEEDALNDIAEGDDEDIKRANN